jgi:hypothetical protein
MSEVRLNFIDSQKILLGTIHGSVVAACVAALSAEPETIVELEAALEGQPDFAPRSRYKHYRTRGAGS